MAEKITIDVDDETSVPLAELVEAYGSQELAIKRSLLAEVRRRRVQQDMRGVSETSAAPDGPIDQAHLDWADAVLERQSAKR